MKTFIYTSLFLAFAYCFASKSMGQQHNFEHFSLEQGLPQSQVEALAQDSLGFIWVGTRGGGLCRFDGKKFKVFKRDDGLPDMEVSELLVDKKGLLWIAGRNSLSYFDGKKFNRIEHPNFEKGGHGDSGNLA